MNVVYTRNLFEALIKQTAQRGGSPSVQNITDAAGAYEKLVQEHAQMLKTLKRVASVCADVSDAVGKSGTADDFQRFMNVRVSVTADIAAIDPAHYGFTPVQEIPVGPTPTK